MINTEEQKKILIMVIIIILKLTLGEVIDINENGRTEKQLEVR